MIKYGCWSNENTYRAAVWLREDTERDAAVDQILKNYQVDGVAAVALKNEFLATVPVVQGVNWTEIVQARRSGARGTR